MLIRGYHCIALFLGHITQRSDPVAFRRPKVNLHTKSIVLVLVLHYKYKGYTTKDDWL